MEDGQAEQCSTLRPGLRREAGISGELGDGVFELDGSYAGISQPCLPGLALVWSWSHE